MAQYTVFTFSHSTIDNMDQFLRLQMTAKEMFSRHQFFPYK